MGDLAPLLPALGAAGEALFHVKQRPRAALVDGWPAVDGAEIESA
jgi:hypothetical protein